MYALQRTGISTMENLKMMNLMGMVCICMQVEMSTSEPLKTMYFMAKGNFHMVYTTYIHIVRTYIYLN